MVMQPRFFLLIADLVTLIDEDCLQTAVRCAQDVCLAAFGIRQILIGCAARFIHACAKLNYLQDHKEVLGMHVHSCVKQAFGISVA